MNRRSGLMLLLCLTAFISCQGEDDSLSPYEWEPYVRNDGQAALSRIKAILRDSGGLPCDEIKKEADEFRARVRDKLGGLSVSVLDKSGPLATPESIAKHDASQIYFEYSNAMKDIHRQCLSVQKQINDRK